VVENSLHNLRITYKETVPAYNTQEIKIGRAKCAANYEAEACPSSIIHMFTFVGVPIGNINDMSLRAAKTILAADIVYAEDTRSFLRLRERVVELFCLTPPKRQEVRTLHKDNEFAIIPNLINNAQSEKNVIFVSESGMPVISDPGTLLVQALHRAGIPYDVIPGPTAFTTALVHYPYPWKQAHFLGFLPKKMTRVTRLFDEFLHVADVEKIVWVAYVSPHNAAHVIEALLARTHVVNMVLMRELTKIHQEVIMITPQTDTTRICGECVLCFQLQRHKKTPTT
jgi:16S rRNA (cytidine1402-2'-O)-methyltransferase